VLPCLSSAALPGTQSLRVVALCVPFVLIVLASDTSVFPPPIPEGATLEGPAVICSRQILPGQCRGGSRALAPVILQRKIEDEKTQLFPTYRPGAGLFRQTAVSASACTSSPSRSSSVTSSQACCHALICSSGCCRPWNAWIPSSFCSVTMIHPLVESLMPFHS
jgi:hypothetical protein